MSLMTEREARLLSPLALAYLGDSVHHLLVRERLMRLSMNQKGMHRQAVRTVNAQAQAKALEGLWDSLSPEEQDIARRGRNAHSHHPAPKSASKGEYALATGYEALLGYLYLTGGLEAARALHDKTQEEDTHA